MVYAYRMLDWEHGPYFHPACPKSNPKPSLSWPMIVASTFSIYQKRIPVGQIDCSSCFGKLLNASPFLSQHAEVELGKIIQKHGWKRAGYVVTIKIYWSMKSEERGLSRKHIIESVKASLLRLQLSYVDIVIIYKADPMCPMEGESPFICRFRCISMPITRTHVRLRAHMQRDSVRGRESHIHFSTFCITRMAGAIACIRL